jgi:Fe-Mn family superoxide dismutase
MLTTRRQALKTLTAAAIASTALGRLPTYAHTPAPAPAAAPAPTGPYTLPPLPYAYDALEPSIDAETMHLHHDKHHKAYVTKLNEALAKEPTFTPPANVDDLVKNLDAVPESIRTAVRNQGGGHANHSLFWQTLLPESKNKVRMISDGAFAQAVTTDLGGLDKLKTEMAEQGGKLFGSGWVWLVLDGGKKLTILTLPNQDSPLTEGHYPLFGIDVWEHAYYLKYHNVRADYIAAIWNVANWDFVSDRYTAAMKA